MVAHDALIKAALIDFFWTLWEAEQTGTSTTLTRLCDDVVGERRATLI